MKINDSKIDKRFATFLETMQEGIEKYPDAFKFVDLETDIKIELKNIVDSGKGEINGSKTPQSKIKCYEKMCTTITNILNNVKL